VSVLRQPERHVAPLLVQVAELWALKSGRLDDLEPHALADFDRRLRALAPGFAYLVPAVQKATSIGDDLAGELERWVQQAKAEQGAKA
jgi:hypothetical protein